MNSSLVTNVSSGDDGALLYVGAVSLLHPPLLCGLTAVHIAPERGLSPCEDTSCAVRMIYH